MNDGAPTLLAALLEDKNGPEKLNAVTERIIGCAYQVSNGLGCGFLEKVYENSMVYEIRKHGLKVEQQKAIRVLYDSVEVGLLPG